MEVPWKPVKPLKYRDIRFGSLGSLVCTPTPAALCNLIWRAMRKEEVLDAAPTAALERSPRFVVLSTLFMQVGSVAELPAGTPLLYDPETRVYNAFDAGDVKPEVLERLVAEGRVYALWGRKVRGMAELGDW